MREIREQHNHTQEYLINNTHLSYCSHPPFMDNSRCDFDLAPKILQKFKELRQARGVSQRDVYIDTDFNIGKIEVGKTNISVSTLSLLCNYYEISRKEFFTEIEAQ